jgi:hypothetical protein
LPTFQSHANHPFLPTDNTPETDVEVRTKIEEERRDLN